MIVAATDDLPTVHAKLSELIARHGTPCRIVALKEDDLLVAAQLSAEWNLPGRYPDDLRVFRDKLLMARVVAGTGIATPAFEPAPERRAVHAFADARPSIS